MNKKTIEKELKKAGFKFEIYGTQKAPAREAYEIKIYDTTAYYGRYRIYIPFTETPDQLYYRIKELKSGNHPIYT